MILEDLLLRFGLLLLLLLLLLRDPTRELRRSKRNN